MDTIHSVPPRHTLPAQADADYEARLQAWERTSTSKDPAKAAGEIRAWLRAGDASEKLDLSYCDLRDIPPLPATVRELSLSGNYELQRAETAWPPGLEYLDASVCDLRVLSALPPVLK
jgi:Leucine-rich repeat (LRR) protein